MVTVGCELVNRQRWIHDPSTTPESAKGDRLPRPSGPQLKAYGSLRVQDVSRLLTTAELARELEVSPRSIQRWRQVGWLEPSSTTLGGHARWDLDKVRERIRELQKREQ